MIESDLLEDLQSKIAFLKKHVIEQDTEIYKLFKSIDGLVKAAKEQKAQLAAVAELNSHCAGYMLADKKTAFLSRVHLWDT